MESRGNDVSKPSTRRTHFVWKKLNSFPIKHLENSFECNAHESKREVEKNIHKSPPLRLSEDPLVMPDPFELPPLNSQLENIVNILVTLVGTTNPYIDEDLALSLAQAEQDMELAKFNEELKQFKIINHRSSMDSRDCDEDFDDDTLNEQKECMEFCIETECMS